MGFEIKCNKCGTIMQLVDVLSDDPIEIYWHKKKILIYCNECDNYFNNEENYDKI